MTRRQFILGIGIMTVGALVPTVASAAGACTDNTSRYRQHTSGGRSQPGRTTRYGQYSGGQSPNCGQGTTQPAQGAQGSDGGTSDTRSSRNTATRRG